MLHHEANTARCSSTRDPRCIHAWDHEQLALRSDRPPVRHPSGNGKQHAASQRRGKKPSWARQPHQAVVGGKKRKGRSWARLLHAFGPTPTRATTLWRTETGHVIELVGRRRAAGAGAGAGPLGPSTGPNWWAPFHISTGLPCAAALSGSRPNSPGDKENWRCSKIPKPKMPTKCKCYFRLKKKIRSKRTLIFFLRKGHWYLYHMLKGHWYLYHTKIDLIRLD